MFDIPGDSGPGQKWDVDYQCSVGRAEMIISVQNVVKRKKMIIPSKTEQVNHQSHARESMTTNISHVLSFLKKSVLIITSKPEQVIRQSDED